VPGGGTRGRGGAGATGASSRGGCGEGLWALESPWRWWFPVTGAAVLPEWKGCGGTESVRRWPPAEREKTAAATADQRPPLQVSRRVRRLDPPGRDGRRRRTPANAAASCSRLAGPATVRGCEKRAGEVLAVRLRDVSTFRSFSAVSAFPSHDGFCACRHTSFLLGAAEALRRRSDLGGMRADRAGRFPRNFRAIGPLSPSTTRRST